jgi:hypothetical protein
MKSSMHFCLYKNKQAIFCLTFVHLHGTVPLHQVEWREDPYKALEKSVPFADFLFAPTSNPLSAFLSKGIRILRILLNGDAVHAYLSSKRNCTCHAYPYCEGYSTGTYLSLWRETSSWCA